MTQLSSIKLDGTNYSYCPYMTEGQLSSCLYTSNIHAVHMPAHAHRYTAATVQLHWNLSFSFHDVWFWWWFQTFPLVMIPLDPQVMQPEISHPVEGLKPRVWTQEGEGPGLHWAGSWRVSLGISFSFVLLYGCLAWHLPYETTCGAHLGPPWSIWPCHPVPPSWNVTDPVVFYTDPNGTHSWIEIQ